MTSLLESQAIIREVNQSLMTQHQIDPDDPIVANIILNQVILRRYVESLGEMLQAHQQQLKTMVAMEEETARKQASMVIQQAGDYAAHRIQSTADNLETRLRSMVLEMRDSHQAMHQSASLFIPWLKQVTLLVLVLLLGVFIGMQVS